MRAYERRYSRELHDLGVATALAHHDPQQLDKTFRPPERRGPIDKYDPANKWW